MKNNILKNNKFKAFWFFFYGIIFLLFLILFFCGINFKINTSLFDILPNANSSRIVSNADSILSSKTSKTFIILAKGNSFDNAKENANLLYEKLSSKENKKFFKNISLFVGENIVSEISEYFYENRFYILNEDDVKKIETDDGIADFISESLLNFYSGIFSSNDIEKDPFLLTEVGMSNTLRKIMDTGTTMNVYDGVLCTVLEEEGQEEKEDKFYVMLRGELTDEGASITNKTSGVKIVFDSIENLNSSYPGINKKYVLSGVPFHSYESSSSAQKEIGIISTVSIVLIILLCYFIFKNFLPIVFSCGAILISVLFSFTSVLVLFKEIHILTFVFGTTLIGICLDYSVHFFVRWAADKNILSGSEIRNHIFKGLLLSLVSTEICYLILLFAPFILLKQVAVFSFVGIMSSFLTVVAFYPNIKFPKKRQINGIQVFDRITLSVKAKKIILLVFVILLAVIFVFVHKRVRIENNLKSFYTMEGKLLEDEIESNKVLDSGSKGWYFIVSGQTKEAVLENEYNFCKQLDKYISNEKNLKMTYNSVTKFIPPISIQKKSYESVKKLIPYTKEQFLLLGKNKDEADFLSKEFVKIYENEKNNYIDLETEIPNYVKDAISNLWIGEVDGKWFSVIMPMHFEDSEYCRQLAEQNPNVYFMNKMNDVGNELNRLTKLMLIFLMIGFIVMLFVLKFFYKWNDFKKIIIIPIITIFSCITILAAFNVPLGFFSVTGIILVFGLGVDYIIYSVESSEKLNTVAVILSFLSSAISFGALALSSFVPVFMFGLTVFVGLLTAVFCTLLVKK